MFSNNLVIGPGKPDNYIQPGTAAPAANPDVPHPIKLNPMGLNGPNAAANATQSDYRVPTVDARVASYVVGGNPMSLPNDRPLPDGHTGVQSFQDSTGSYLPRGIVPPLLTDSSPAGPPMPAPGPPIPTPGS